MPSLGKGVVQAAVLIPILLIVIGGALFIALQNNSGRSIDNAQESTGSASDFNSSRSDDEELGKLNLPRYYTLDEWGVFLEERGSGDLECPIADVDPFYDLVVCHESSELAEQAKQEYITENNLTPIE